MKVYCKDICPPSNKVNKVKWDFKQLLKSCRYHAISSFNKEVL